MKRTLFSARNIALLAVLVALVIVLQLCSVVFKVGATSLSFVLVPIVFGGILIGAWAGALLGFVFGIIVIVMGLTGMEAFTFILLNEQPVLTVLLCLVKGTLAGLGSGLLYKLVAKKNGYVAVFVASLSAPIINTGIFILGGLMMSGTIMAIPNMPQDASIMYILVVICAGINFLVEFAINVVCSPAIYTVTNAVSKQIKVRKKKNDNLS